MSAPIIGLTTYPSGETHGWHTPNTYVEAVLRAGGVPVLLPGLKNGCGQAWLEAVDGVVFIGGGDIDPQAFGGQHHETIYNLSPERDNSELTLMKALLAHPKPTLAICRGLQILNTVLGGTLHVHLPDVVGEDTLHRALPRDPIVHPVRIDGTSRLGQVLGEQADIASWHHQAIDRLGDGLRPVAWAADGVIEAVELEGFEQFTVVQWHPEITADKDALQQQLFNQLVEQAKQNAQKQ